MKHEQTMDGDSNWNLLIVENFLRYHQGTDAGSIKRTIADSIIPNKTLLSKNYFIEKKIKTQFISMLTLSAWEFAKFRSVQEV